jgi:hypothetical protein
MRPGPAIPEASLGGVSAVDQREARERLASAMSATDQLATTQAATIAGERIHPEPAEQPGQRRSHDNRRQNEGVGKSSATDRASPVSLI